MLARISPQLSNASLRHRPRRNVDLVGLAGQRFAGLVLGRLFRSWPRLAQRLSEPQQRWRLAERLLRGRQRGYGRQRLCPKPNGAQKECRGAYYTKREPNQNHVLKQS